MLSLSRPSKWYGWKSIYTALNFGIFAKISKASVFIQYCIVMILLLLALSSQPWWGSLSSSHVVSILYLHQSCTNKNFSGRRTSQISPMAGFGLFCCTNKPLNLKTPLKLRKKLKNTKPTSIVLQIIYQKNDCIYNTLVAKLT